MKNLILKVVLSLALPLIACVPKSEPISPESNLTATETLCDDGVDNDQDGIVDCSDADCKNQDVCTAEDCENGVDDNGDGAVDCDDPKCSDSTQCQSGPPYEFGHACETEEDCISTQCLDTGASMKFCSATCSLDAQCGEGAFCNEGQCYADCDASCVGERGCGLVNDMTVCLPSRPEGKGAFEACVDDDECAGTMGRCDAFQGVNLCTEECLSDNDCSAGPCFDGLCFRDCNVAQDCNDPELECNFFDPVCFPAAIGTTPIGGKCDRTPDCAPGQAAAGAFCMAPETWGYPGGNCTESCWSQNGGPQYQCSDAGQTCLGNIICVPTCDDTSDCGEDRICDDHNDDGQKECLPPSFKNVPDNEFCVSQMECENEEAVCTSMGDIRFCRPSGDCETDIDCGEGGFCSSTLGCVIGCDPESFSCPGDMTCVNSGTEQFCVPPAWL